MSGLLGFVMRTRLGAIGAVALGALLPLLFWVSGGLLALITLRRGLAEVLIVLGAATAVLLPIHMALGTPMAVLQPLALIWLPVIALAQILRQSVSLAMTLQIGALIATLAIVGFYALHGDPAAFWQGTLQALAQALSGGQPGPEWQRAAAELAPRLTGLWVANMLGLVVLCVLLGRWWQAVLYNPGGFQSEFHALRFDRWFAGLGVAAVALSVLSPPGLLSDIGVVLGAVFLLQALAVAHALVALRGWHVGWLIGFYLLVPLLMRPLAVVGMADPFIDLRARLAPAA